MTGGPRPKRSAAADQLLALNLVAAIRTAAYYDAQNSVMQQVCSAFYLQLAGRLAERPAELDVLRVGVNSQCVFVDSVRVRTSLSTQKRFTYLVELFAGWGINTLAFHPGVHEAELMSLAMIMAREARAGPDALRALLTGKGVTHIDVDMLEQGTGRQVVAPVEAYAAALQVGEQLRRSAETAEHANQRLARHVTQAVVDQVMGDPSSLLALTTIKESDRYLISHSANVAILSVLLGQRLGLSKSRLGELCLAAFLHDAGKLDVPPDILNKPGPLDSEEWEEVRTHPVTAALALLGAKRLTAASMRAVVVAYEHHLNYDLSGYPPTTLKDHVSLFGNIVTIADRYDALTTARPYRRVNFTPHEAVVHLISNAGRYFDPALVKLFVEMVGLYPPGTLVGLDTGDVGVVCEPPVVGQALDRPVERLLTPGRVGEIVDLRRQSEGRYALSVAVVLNPANQGQIPAVDPAIFFQRMTQAAGI
jgi:HD-GYP domain-containing protein (c-di-GMP phosphodiesterase class II)